MTAVAPGTSYDLTVTRAETAADGVLALTLAPADGETLAWEPGAHLELRLPSGRVRQYSLCGDPADRSQYRVAVLREPDGRGGSEEVHALAQAGVTFGVRGPRNHFPLVDAESYLFLAGGIGVTPILAMVREAARRGADFRVVYGGRTRASMAFRDELAALAGDRLDLRPQDETGVPDLTAILADAGPATAVYCCGPTGMIAAAEAPATASGSGSGCTWSASPATTRWRSRSTRRSTPSSRSTSPGPAGRCASRPTGGSSRWSRRRCPACRTTARRVLRRVRDAGAGYEPEHRDSLLTDEERAAGRTMMICVGRCSSDRLVLDL